MHNLTGKSERLDTVYPWFQAHQRRTNSLQTSIKEVVQSVSQFCKSKNLGLSSQSIQSQCNRSASQKMAPTLVFLTENTVEFLALKSATLFGFRLTFTSYKHHVRTVLRTI